MHLQLRSSTTIEDNHTWTDLKQMLEWLNKFETIDKQYLKTGLENTLNNGYNLYNLNELIKQYPNDMDLGKTIRNLGWLNQRKINYQ